jgi:hypothetical protein
MALVTAIAARLAIEPPSPVSFDQAREVAAARRPTSLPSAGCFVCGLEREPGDALRIVAGDLEPGRTAAPWVPGPAFAGPEDAGGGEVALEVVVAALDCPGGWAIAARERRREPLVLGRISIATAAGWPVRIGLPHVVVGSAAGAAGRKRFADTAIYDLDGRLCIAARSVWFPMP